MAIMDTSLVSNYCTHIFKITRWLISQMIIFFLFLGPIILDRTIELTQDFANYGKIVHV